MTAKQILNAGTAPDGSQYVVLTDGAGNLTPVSSGTVDPNGQATMANSAPVVIASDQSAVLVKPNSDYPSGATPLTASATGTTGATTATLAAAIGKTTYIAGFSIRATATAAAVGNATVTGTVTGTLNFTQFSQAASTGMVPLELNFTRPIPASTTNTAIAVVSAAPGTGGVVSVSAWGYQL